ncbi:hypothetical protein ACXR2T_07975 [Leucobacter sp. HY1910]
MPSTKYVRARYGGTCEAEFFHPNLISPGDITRVTTHFSSDELVTCHGVPAFTRTRVCQWCVIRDAQHGATRDEYGLLQFRDKHGDVWVFGPDGLMHTKETAPFSFEHVQKKWGPLRIIGDAGVKEGAAS